MLNSGWIYRDRIRAVDDGCCVLAFYTSHYRHSTEAVWRARIEGGEIRRGTEVLSPESLIHTDDTLEWHRPPWEEPEVPTEIPILYEDESILVVDKPSGLPVLPDGGFLENNLVSLMKGYSIDGVAPAPVHRLGRGTSGVLLMARTAQARSDLCEQFRRITRRGEDPVLKKVYRALTVPWEGTTDALEIHQPIGPIPHPRLGRVHAASASGRPSCSRCLRLRHGLDQDLWEIDLVTGRPHQIRIHLASIGAPLVGDPFYTKGGIPRADGLGRPGDVGYTLRSCVLRFRHPRTGEPFEVTAPIPHELQGSK